MNIKWAENQLIVARDSTTQSITTNPVRLPPNNSASIIVNVHYILDISGNSSELTVTYQFSNDGTNWWDVDPTIAPVGDITAAGTYSSTGNTNAQFEFMRVKFTFDPDAGSSSNTGDAFIMFDAWGRIFET